jgi:hypothetical protein
VLDFSIPMEIFLGSVFTAKSGYKNEKAGRVRMGKNKIIPLRMIKNGRVLRKYQRLISKTN